MPHPRLHPACQVHQLQAETRTRINNNEQLKAVSSASYLSTLVLTFVLQIFGCDSMDVSSLLRHLDEHLSPPEPIEISARLGGRDQCYDVQVPQVQSCRYDR